MVVVTISQCMCIRLTCHTPATYTMVYVDDISIKLGVGEGRSGFQ